MYIMLKPAGSLCNLRCKYCYYLEKSKLYDDNKNHVITDALLEKFIKEYIEAQTTPQVLFTWHGGETLMRPISFYRRALELQRYYARGRQIDNSIQTNGTLLNDEWCRFFKENNFLVGVSIDGPQEFHDEYRRNAMGKPSFHQVMKGIDLLNKHGVEWNALAVVNDFNADYPLDFYHFFKEIGCRYIQFTPIVQLFDATLANWVGVAPGICTMAKECGHAGVMEYNGDVYSCDHFVYPEHKLGNLSQHTIYEMMNSDRQKDFSKMKYRLLPQQCKECKYQFACHGECPKNRFIRDCYGNPGLNYLCKGYHQFFEHVAPYMDFMKNELENQRPPANVMNQVFGK